MNAQEFWNIDNVSSFRSIDVRNGEVSLSNEEYRDHLNEIYGSVEVCGQTFDQGDLLEDADPVAFRCGKSDYESEIQSELESQLCVGDSADIHFIDGDEWELSDEEECDEDECLTFSKYKTVTVAWGHHNYGVIDSSNGRMHAWSETEEGAIEDLYRTTLVFPGSYIVAIKVDASSKYSPSSNSFTPQ